MRTSLCVFGFLLMLSTVVSTATAGSVDELPDFDALWDYRHPDVTEQTFRKLIPAAKESGNVSYYAQLLTQIARTEGLQRRFEDAHRTLDSAHVLLTDKLPVAEIRYLLERGRVYNSSGSIALARPLFVEAWEKSRDAGEDFYAIDAAHMMAIVEPPDKQLAWAERAIATAETSESERARSWLTSLYNNTGWTYHDLGKYEQALDMFEKALSWEQENRKDEWRILIARWTIARTYRSLGRITEALAIQRALEAEISEKGLEQDGYVFEELAECLLQLGETAEAGNYFKRAYELLSQDEWFVANKPDRLTRMKELGGVEDE